MVEEWSECWIIFSIFQPGDLCSIVWSVNLCRVIFLDKTLLQIVSLYPGIHVHPCIKNYWRKRQEVALLKSSLAVQNLKVAIL